MEMLPRQSYQVGLDQPSMAPSADMRTRGLPVARSVTGQCSPMLLSLWVAGQIPCVTGSLNGQMPDLV